MITHKIPKVTQYRKIDVKYCYIESSLNIKINNNDIALDDKKRDYKVEFNFYKNRGSFMIHLSDDVLSEWTLHYTSPEIDFFRNCVYYSSP